MSDHLLGDGNVYVALSIVHLEFQTDEVGQYRGGARLGPDRWYPLTGLRPYNGEAGGYSAMRAWERLKVHTGRCWDLGELSDTV